MKITLADGNVIEGYLPSPKGSFHNPLSPDEVREKFIRLGSTVLSEDRLNSLIEKVDNIEKEEDTSRLGALLSHQSEISRRQNVN